MYKQAIIDIDGTITAGQDHVSARVINAVRAAAKRGVPVCVCTGRHGASARPIIDTLAIGHPYAVVDGAAIMDGKTHAPIFENLLPPETLRGIVARAMSGGLYIEAVTNEYYNKYIQLAPGFDYGLGRLNVHAKYFEAKPAFLAAAERAYEVICGGPQPAVDALMAELAAEYGGAVGIRHGLWAGYIFISAPGVGKAHGARRLAEMFGNSMEDVVAIGDDLNDLDMLAEAGLGIAMANGHERAKAAAKAVTPSVEEDGAAVALEKYFLVNTQ